MSAPDETRPKPEETPAKAHTPKYTPRAQTMFRKGGEAVTKIGSGAATLSAIPTVASDLLDRQIASTASTTGALFFVVGLAFIALGVYMQAEADR